MIFLNTYRLIYSFVRMLFFICFKFLPKPLSDWYSLRKLASHNLNQMVLAFDVQKNSKNSDTGQAIWFHAASGEIEYVKGVIRELKKQSPSQKIVLTYSSVSAERLLFNIKDEIDLILPLPWDDPKNVQSLVELIKPKLLVFAKTDFWPELIYQLEKQKIPMSVVSFTLLGKKRLNALTSWALPKMTKILCADPSTQKTLTEFHLKSEVFGDTRFDQVLFRLENEPRIYLKDHSSCPFFVFASTWPADDQILISCAEELIQKGFKLIWCPHDVGPDRVLELHQKISSLGSISIQKLSEFNSIQIEVTAQVLLIDRIGFLADVFRFSKFAFVGGSFERRVHSVMEPLCAGNMVFVGPFYKNNLEAVELSQLGLVHVVQSAKEFISQLNDLDAPTVTKKQIEILKFCNEKRGAAKKIAQNLLRAVTSPH